MKIFDTLRFVIAAASLVISAAVAPAQEVRPWMHSETGEAWRLGYRGQGTSITVIDDFRSNYGIYGDLRG
ncbi:MAG: hypothetical protein FJX19_12630, partial [Alphaproteobacteria bacterium]|nr:hypothetical protein [Alphaproteobacteria bacterium]